MKYRTLEKIALVPIILGSLAIAGGVITLSIKAISNARSKAAAEAELKAAAAKSPYILEGKWWRTRTSIYEMKHRSGANYLKEEVRKVERTGAWHDPITWAELEAGPGQNIEKTAIYSCVMNNGSDRDEMGIQVEEYNRLEVGKYYEYDNWDTIGKEIPLEK